MVGVPMPRGFNDVIIETPSCFTLKEVLAKLDKPSDLQVRGIEVVRLVPGKAVVGCGGCHQEKDRAAD